MPSFYETEKFKSEQRYWYREIKRRGFNDIEHGCDYNQYHATTIPGKAPEQRIHSDAPSVSDTETARYWRLVGQIAAAMYNHPLYPLVRAYADTGSITAAAAASGMQRVPAMHRLRKLLTPFGLWKE